MTEIPIRKAALFIGSAFALMIPYLAFVIYFSFQFPSGHWPDWLLYTIMVWFVANFFILMIVARRIFRGQKVDLDQARKVRSTVMKRSLWLVTVWTGFFVYGAVKTFKGDFPLSRALPAGAFLLLFIGVFGWGIYRDVLTRRAEKRQGQIKGAGLR